MAFSWGGALALRLLTETQLQPFASKLDTKRNTWNLLLQVLQLFSFQVWVWILEWIPRLLAKYAYFAQDVGLAGFWLNSLKIRRKVGSIFEFNDICHKAEKHTLWQMGGLSRLAYAVSEDKTWQGPTILLCPTYKAIAHVSCTSFPVKELDHQVQLGIFFNFRFPNWP